MHPSGGSATPYRMPDMGCQIGITFATNYIDWGCKIPDIIIFIRFSYIFIFIDN